MPEEIPLFPLRTVLFPGMPLALRVFEERYLRMVQDLPRSGGIFGVLLIRQGEEVGGGARPFDVGTTASIEESEEVEGGQLVIACRGLRRFRLLTMLPPAPYPRGQIEYLEERRPPRGTPLIEVMTRIESTFPEYFQLAQALTDQWARPFPLPDDPHAAVDLLGPWLRTEETEKQRLLEIEDPIGRARCLASLLERLVEQLRPQVREHRRRRYGGLSARN